MGLSLLVRSAPTLEPPPDRSSAALHASRCRRAAAGRAAWACGAAGSWALGCAARLGAPRESSAERVGRARAPERSRCMGAMPSPPPPRPPAAPAHLMATACRHSAANVLVRGACQPAGAPAEQAWQGLDPRPARGRACGRVMLQQRHPLGGCERTVLGCLRPCRRRPDGGAHTTWRSKRCLKQTCGGASGGFLEPGQPDRRSRSVQLRFGRLTRP